MFLLTIEILRINAKTNNNIVSQVSENSFILRLSRLDPPNFGGSDCGKIS